MKTKREEIMQPSVKGTGASFLCKWSPYVFSVLTASLVLNSACAPTSPKKQGPVEEYGSVELTSAAQSVDLTPKVDILVVIDNSLSMGKHQKNLSDNIEKFVTAFAENQSLDFHFAMIPIWDSFHFNHDQKGQTVTKHLKMGELLPLKNPQYTPSKSNQTSEYLEGPRYVTRQTPNYIDVMKKTLLLGETPGPAYEESFTPIVPALISKEMTDGPNKGFYRKDAFLIVVIISDADDSNVEISPDVLALQLFALKGKDRSRVASVGVVVPSTDRKCPKDQAAPEGAKRIERFVENTNGKILNLCSSNFGEDLAQIGRDLSVRVPRQIIKLTSIPDMSDALQNADPKLDKSFRVMMGDQPMPKAVSPNFDNGWSYDPQSNSVIIGPKTVITGKIDILYTPVKAYNVLADRVKLKK